MFKNPDRGGEEKPEYFKLLETFFFCAELKKKQLSVVFNLTIWLC